MKYKEYKAQIAYDDEARLFHGIVLYINDVINFEGDCVEELSQAFKDSVEDYLAFYKERGEEPEKLFS